LLWIFTFLSHFVSLLPPTARRSFALAFPSMLVESKGGCMVELSTEEVIMNNPVVVRFYIEWLLYTSMTIKLIHSVTHIDAGMARQ
jgi:hypothetical protein